MTPRSRLPVGGGSERGHRAGGRERLVVTVGGSVVAERVPHADAGDIPVKNGGGVYADAARPVGEGIIVDEHEGRDKFATRRLRG